MAWCDHGHGEIPGFNAVFFVGKHVEVTGKSSIAMLTHLNSIYNMDISITEIIFAYLYNMAYEVETYSLNMFEYKSIIVTCWK